MICNTASLPFIVYPYQEVWVPLNSYDIRKNTYMISNYGKIYNINKNIIMKQQEINSGYMIVTLVCDGSKRKNAKFLLHRLVADSFVPRYNLYQDVVNHKDIDKHNNYYDNLEWMSQKENNEYKKVSGTFYMEKITIIQELLMNKSIQYVNY